MDWLDYFSPVNFTKTTTKLTDDNSCRLLRDDCNDEQVKIRNDNNRKKFRSL